MFSIEFLLKLLNRDKISKYIYTLLFVSLITIFDFFTLFIFSEMIGIYLYLAIIATITFIGIIILINFIKKQIIKLEKKHDVGIFPKEEFYHITTLFITSIFIVFPGIISSALGLIIIIIPQLRVLIGRILSKSLKLDWYAVYEYKEIYNN